MDLMILIPRISDGATALQSALVERNVGVSKRRRDSLARYRRRVAPLKIINWGCGGTWSLDDFNLIGVGSGMTIMNQRTDRATNKLEAFRRWYELSSTNRGVIPIPGFTASRRIAQRWTTEGHRVYCRTELRGNSGRDIVIASTPEEVVDAPLYTKEVVKRHEFRIHVFNGVVIDGVRKAFRPSIPQEERNRDIMNHAAGTIFVRSGNALEAAKNNEVMLNDCVRAVGAVGLNFGAVDVMTDSDGNHYIIEVNTAPGLEGTTLTRYADAITNWVNEETITPWNEQPNINNQERESEMQVQVNTNNTTSTLTTGQLYTVEQREGDRYQLRNDNGRLQWYTDRGQLDVRETTTPSAPSAPQPQLQALTTRDDIVAAGNETSVNRVVALPDGSLVNPGGRVEVTSTINSLQQGRQTVHEIRCGISSSGLAIFLGFMIDGEVKRYRLEGDRFTNGSLSSVQVTQSTETPQAPQVLHDSRGNQLSVGDQVVVTSSAGGHGLSAGLRVTIGSVNVQRNLLNVTITGRSNRVNINPSRVRKLTTNEIQAMDRERVAIRETTTITIGSTEYRVRVARLADIHNHLRQFSV